MKKFITFAVATGSLVYYACLPFFIAQAGEIPGVNTPSGANIAIFHMRVTAYSSSADESDYYPYTITADGSHVHDGVAASNILPFGTKIRIPAIFGDKIFVIHDRMSKRIKNTIDLWMPSKRQALIFGVSHTDIVVISTPTSTHLLATAK